MKNKPETKQSILAYYNCGPVKLSGDPDALYERHFTFDQVVAETETTDRDKFEAIARSVRDVLSQRWLKTEETYRQRNAKRVYYLSMEFLLGRALANNACNLLIAPEVQKFAKHHMLDPLQINEQEPDAGLGNGGLGRLAACFLDSMATLGIAGMGYGLRYDYGIFRQSLRDGWQAEQPDHWLARPDPWEVARPNEVVEVKLNVSFEIRNGALRVVEGRSSTLIGIPYDRPVVGYGGKTINTLRLWAVKASNDFDFAQFSSGDFVGALAETLTAETITRVLYPDDHTTEGKGLRFLQEYFLVACSLADLVRRFRAAGNDWSALPEKVAIQLNDTHPAIAVPELMRLLLDEANLGWPDAWSLTQRTLAYTNHTLLPEALEKWPVQWFQDLLPRHLEIIYEINRRFLDDVRAKYPGDGGRIARVSLIEEGPRPPGPHGASGHRRLAQHQRRGRAAFGTAQAARRAGFCGAVSRAIQQQNQRRHAAPLAVAGQPAAGIGHHQRDRRWLDHRLGAVGEIETARRRPCVLRRRSQRETRGEDALHQVAGKTGH